MDSIQNISRKSLEGFGTYDVTETLSCLRFYFLDEKVQRFYHKKNAPMKYFWGIEIT